MKKDYFSESDMINAVSKVRIAMLGVLPEPDVCEHKFSKSFEEKIRLLQKKERQHQILHVFFKTAKVAILAIIVSLTVFLAINTEARASVITWIKEYFEERIVYWFIGSENEVLPIYDLTWVPNGQECVYDEILDNSRSIIYIDENNPENGFILYYGIAQNGSNMTLSTVDGEYTTSEVKVNECYGDLFYSNDPNASHNLVWMDEDRNIVFNISSNMNPDVLLHIAENLVLVKN